LGLGFLVDDVRMGVGFAIFWMMSLVDPRGQFVWLKISLDLRL